MQYVFILNCSNKMNVYSALWILMASCFRASVATVLTTHSCISRCLRVNDQYSAMICATETNVYANKRMLIFNIVDTLWKSTAPCYKCFAMQSSIMLPHRNWVHIVLRVCKFSHDNMLSTSQNRTLSSDVSGGVLLARRVPAPAKWQFRCRERDRTG